jgi:hypothetical protein
MRNSPQNRAARALGFSSGFEHVLAQQLEQAGVEVEYESLVIPFTQPVKPRKYTPDFPLPNGIIVESKGRFVTADRQKHLLVKAQHPDLEIRFVFDRSNTRISKQSQTTYAAWCEAKGFKYADKLIPTAWLKEAPNARSLAAIRRLMED